MTAVDDVGVGVRGDGGDAGGEPGMPDLCQESINLSLNKYSQPKGLLRFRYRGHLYGAVPGRILPGVAGR
ncbi:hypothetical protein [Streptomyces sp. NEAU-W12]|uniref:hypothetical protein n=1 Tax=Streptomyces sp. NEAU-W12 TaxID=2994668 RepID=UPI00224B1284|nr:hypothetical protein [Streptomyces sp. NEAU-W12]MCX2923636.1 hypothetical protein [Streptomyces sp. NEAU-W12]